MKTHDCLYSVSTPETVLEDMMFCSFEEARSYLWDDFCEFMAQGDCAPDYLYANVWDQLTKTSSIHTDDYDGEIVSFASVEYEDEVWQYLEAIAEDCSPYSPSYRDYPDWAE